MKNPKWCTDKTPFSYPLGSIIVRDYLYSHGQKGYSGGPILKLKEAAIGSLSITQKSEQRQQTEMPSTYTLEAKIFCRRLHFDDPIQCLTMGETTTGKLGLSECAVEPCEMDKNYACETEKMQELQMDESWIAPKDPKGKRRYVSKTIFS